MDEQPRYTPNEFLARLLEQASEGPIAYTSGEQARIVVMLYDTYKAMKDRIDELEDLLGITQNRAHRPINLNGGNSSGFIPLTDLLKGQEDEEEE